ncbi:MAG: ISAs1 family transposase [Anaerolineales bacterium]|nr:ISAs1 family transposase [Anaerolineales bacterium]MCB9134982.1 ISAs1 family transposase [Anaerolineales bacterium]
MSQKPTASLEKHFSSLTDPRTGNAKQHLFLEIILLAICAVICGANSWTDIELFGKKKHKWLKSFLRLPKGIPSHDTFGRVFAHLNPEEFQTCFIEWVKALVVLTEGQVIAVDGKQLRGSHDQASGKKALYMVSAWATANHLVLGQTKVAEKSNEITAIPELLKSLALTGCIVTVDALGTQTEIAQTVIDGGGDYILAVKGNQGHLFEDLQYLFEVDAQHHFKDVPHTYAKTVNKGHGRLEIRECWVITDKEYLTFLRGHKNWAGLRALIRIVSERRVGGQVEIQTRYFISSLALKAKAMLKAKRSHWQIENQVHWVLDVAFQEDASRVRKGYSPENLAILRHMALNMLRKEKTAHGGIQAKRLQAAWDHNYLLTILRS